MLHVNRIVVYNVVTSIYLQTGESALHFAVMAGKIEIVKILIEDYGVDPTIRNNVSRPDNNICNGLRSQLDVVEL